jgi:hypothetical protein
MVPDASPVASLVLGLTLRSGEIATARGGVAVELVQEF